MNIKRTFEIEAKEEDLKLLDEYGFYYKKNIEKMIMDVAAQMRACIAMQKAEKTNYIENEEQKDD